MSPKSLLKRRSFLIVTGCAVLVVLVFIGTRELEIRYARSHAATSYTAVLAEIQQATSTQAIYALAEGAGLKVSSSSEADPDDNLDTDTEFLITDPSTGAVLAAVTEYDDVFPSPPIPPSSTSLPPAIPVNLQVTGETSSTISLSWQEPKSDISATYYGIYRNGIEVGTTTQMSFTDTGLTEYASNGSVHILYSYYVVAYSSTGASSGSVPLTAYPAVQPSQVTGLSASVSGDTVTLSWSPAIVPLGGGSLEGYTVYIATSTNCVESQSSMVGAGGMGWSNSYDNSSETSGEGPLKSQTQFLEANLPPGIYYYCVAAYDKDDTFLGLNQSSVATPWNNAQGPVSVPVRAVITSYVDTTPSVPLNFRQTSSTSSGMTLSWTPSTDAAGGMSYEIWGSDDKNGVWTPDITTKGSSVTYSPATINVQGETVPYSYVTYEIDAVDAKGNKSRVVGGGSPDDGQGLIGYSSSVLSPELQPVAVTIVTSGYSASLSIFANTGNDVPKVNIYRSNTSGCAATSADLLVANVPISGVNGAARATYNDTNIPLGTYYYCAAIVDPFGNIGAVSSQAVVTITGSVFAGPSMPSDLSVTNVGKTSISLSWTASVDPYITIPSDSSDDLFYKIYRNGTQIATTTNTTFVDNDIVQNQLYVYSVVAYHPYGNYASPQSVEAAGEIASPGVPSIPTDLTIATTTNASVSISWKPSTETGGAVAGYWIFRNGGEAGTSTATSFTDTHLIASTTYTYAIMAYDKNGISSPLSPNVTVMASNGGSAPASALPSTPTGLFVATTTTSTISLSWTASTESGGTILGYDIYRSGVQVGTSAVASFTDINLAASTAYSYTIASYDAKGTISSQSNSVSGTTNGSLTRVISQPIKVCPAWGCNGPEPIMGSLLPTSTSTPTPTSTPSPTSSSAKASVTVPVVPSVPTGLTATSITASSISLSWTASTESDGTIAGYNIYRNNTLIGTSVNPSFTDTGLTAGTTYIYTVASYDTKGNVSSQSNGASDTTSSLPSIRAKAPVSIPIISRGALLLNNLLTPSIACAQTTGGGSTVEGNLTGQTASCDVAGGTEFNSAQVTVFSDGNLYGVGGNGNYNFTVSDEGDEYDENWLAGLNADAQAADNAIQAVGGPTVLANDSSNQIFVDVNENHNAVQAYSQIADGLALSVATLQDDGTYRNTCIANVFIPTALNGLSGISGANTSVYLTNVFTHEIGHCLGLGHSNDPTNIMYGGGLAGTAAVYIPLDFNTAQIQFLQDRAAGKTISVDPDSCTPVCDAGEGFVPSDSQVSSDENEHTNECISQQKLCGGPETPNTTWNDETQSCLSCPGGTTANLDTGSCDPEEETSTNCSVLSPGYDYFSNLCVSTSTQTCAPDDDGTMQCTYPGGDECDCGSDGSVSCVDTNGDSVATPAMACQGRCATGEVQMSDGSCIVNCDQYPDDPSCPGAPPDADYCDQHSDDPNCSTMSDTCNSDSYAVGCPDYCADYPQDSSCGGDGGNGGDSSDAVHTTQPLIATPQILKTQVPTVSSKTTLMQGMLNQLDNLLRSL